MCGERKETIVFLNHWSEKPGGAEYSLVDILRQFSTDFQLHLITTESGYLVNSASGMGVRCHVVCCTATPEKFRRDQPAWKLPFRVPSLLKFLFFAVRVHRIVKKIRPDRIHANVPKSHALLYLLGLFGFRGRAVFHIREIFTKGSMPWKLYPLFLRGRKGEIIAISHAVKSSLPQKIQKKAQVIYNGIEVLGPDDGWDLNSCSSLNFLYIGRVVRWKGCHGLIEAFSRLKSRGAEGECTLSLIGDSSYGDTGYRDELRGLIKEKGLTGSVSLFDHREQPWRSVKKPAVFCTASVKEPFGRSVAEAQGCGLAVVGFSSGGIKEIVQDGVSGLLVPENDIEAFSRAMERLLVCPDLREYMGQQGYKRAHTLFNREVQMPVIREHILGMKNWEGLRF